MIDTHCHLTFPDFQGKVPETLAEASAHGVNGCITISTTTRDCLEALALAQQYPNVWCTSGVHPLHSHEEPEGGHDWDAIVRVAQSPRCVAWGELGLDNHYDQPPRSVQLPVLEHQLALIASLLPCGTGVPPVRNAIDSQHGRDACATRPEAPGISKPIVIHCREAFGDLIPILKASRLDPTRFVFHCFTGTPDDARAVLDFGAMISFTGVITYKNAQAVREAAKLVPLDRLMVETDAPFLPPEPRRGERPCKPWMTSLTARRLAEVHGHTTLDAWNRFHQTLIASTTRFFAVNEPMQG